jgi:hypothetical protein
VAFDRRALIRQAAVIRSAILLKCLQLIQSETHSGLPDAAGRRPDFAILTVADFQEYCGVPVRRSVEVQLANGERAGWIKREFPERHHSRGGYRIDWERLGAAPDPEPRAQRADKGQPKRHAVRGSMQPKTDADLTPAEPKREPVEIRLNLNTSSVPSAMGCGLGKCCPLLVLTSNQATVVVTEVTTVSAPTTPICEGEPIGDTPDIPPTAPNTYLAGFPEPLDFPSVLARLFAIAGKPVPTPRQAAGVADALAKRGLECGGFIEWCSIDRGRVRRARGPGVLDSWIAEYSVWADVRAAIEAEGAAERERRTLRLVEPEAEPAELEAERPELAPRPVAPAVCWRCGGTGELHNLSDLEAFTPCGCAAGRAKRRADLKT